LPAVPHVFNGKLAAAGAKGASKGFPSRPGMHYRRAAWRAFSLSPVFLFSRFGF